MSENERRLYDSIVHGLRSSGWSRLEAETEALDRVFKLRDRNAPLPPQTHNLWKE